MTMTMTMTTASRPSSPSTASACGTIPSGSSDDLGLVATEAGYEVGAEPAEPARRAGLEPGDLVAKVNGQQLGDIGRDRRFFR